MIVSFRLMLALFALTSVALAGCLTQGGEPLTQQNFVGGSAIVPDVVAAGAEITKLSDAVELLWKDATPPTAPLTVGVPFVGNLMVAQSTVDKTFTLPPEVTVVTATLTWADASVDLDLAVIDEAGGRQCRSVDDVGVKEESCKVHKVAARSAAEEWTVRAIAFDHPDGAVPFELRVHLSVAPFPILGPALAPAQRAPGLSFFDTRVDEERRTGEPSLKVDHQGNVYIAAPTGKMQSLWRTSDGGESFEYIDIMSRAGNARGVLWDQQGVGRGGGDAEVFVTPDGQEVYFADLWGTCMTVGGSADAGETWTVNPLSCELPGTDRQWLWAQPGGHLWMNFNGASVGQNVCRTTSMVTGDSCGGHLVMHSLDGGSTWPFRIYIHEDQCARGNIAVDDEGRIYAAGCNADGPGIAVVEPGSMDYTYHTVADRSGEPLAGFCFVCGIFTVVDLDTKGNPYVVWADPSQDGMGFDIWMVTSQDKGATWSDPVMVNKADGNALLPWVAAGEPGHVVVAWYQTAQKGSPDLMETGEWYTHVAVSWNGLDAAPTFEENLAWEQPVQYGPLCITGSRCDANRNLLDFLMVDIDPAGAAHVAFNDGGHGGSPRNSYVMYARQLLPEGMAPMGDAPYGAPPLLPLRLLREA